MQIVNVTKDGTIVIEIPVREATDVRDDLAYIPFSLISPSGAELCNLIETVFGRETL